jgi:hypothetical protein
MIFLISCRNFKRKFRAQELYAPSDRQMYHLQFSLQEASPETFGYTHVSLSKTFIW